jgi:hypothetical protein
MRMNTPPDEAPPDDLNDILASEAFEESDDYTAATVAWMSSDADTIEAAKDRFAIHGGDDYEDAFQAWLEAGAK